MDTKTKLNEIRRTHLWDYFSLHANQRISLFGKYIVLFVLFVTSSGFLITRFSHSSIVDEVSEIALCVIFLVLTFIFFKIDSRNRDLIKLAEEGLIKVEEELSFPESSKLFVKEKQVACLTFFRHTRCFHFIYCFSTVIAIANIVISIICLICKCN